MRKGTIRSIKHPSRYPSLWLLAAAICLWPAAAAAGTLAPNDTASGNGALANEDGGNYNTANGYSALWFNTTGSFNTASGENALFFTTTGSFNTASGEDALYSNTVGNNNTASGAGALFSNSTGGNNVAVGANALSAINGSNNIALGFNAGKNTKSGNDNIYVGDSGVSGSESKVIRIGSGQTKTFIAGIAGTAMSGATVLIKSNGQLGVVVSSARYKQDIKPLAGAAGGLAEKLARLQPVSFRYKAEPEATHYGLIAEEVDKVMPELVVRDSENRPYSVQYLGIVPLLLQQWKVQRVEIARQQAEIMRERALIERQEAALTEMRRTLATRFAAFDRADRGYRAGGK